MSKHRGKAVVLGAGIQGVCSALALRSEGYRVTLVDRAFDCMMRASGRNEAKIHLGFVYANDDSFRTASLMLDAALSFAPLLESWSGREFDWRRLTSRPFHYAAMNDSVLSRGQLQAFYDRIQCAYAERLDGRHYLGERPRLLWRKHPETALPTWIAKAPITGMMETVELALNLGRFRQELAETLASFETVEALYGHEVESVRRTPSGFRVGGITGSGERWEREADIVVNSLWEGRLRLDAEMGLPPPRAWVYRLKYRLLGELPASLADLPSLTFALGPYGDVATYPGGRAYLNWYPACLRGWSDELTPPAEWNDACTGVVPQPVADEITRDTLMALDRIVPGIAETRIDHIDAGVIVSWGVPHVDVDDPRSELHERHDIGLHADDGYFSIDTGKFTCGPLFAQRLLDYLR